jgi:predicted Zn-dependent protease with MMP-like domain
MEPTIICLNSEALEELIDKIVIYINQVHQMETNDWITTETAMQLLGISSSTTLSRLRSEGKIRYSQPMHKVILYSRKSIWDYLNNHAKNTF